MYHQQVNVINTFRMFLDAASIIAAGYAGYYLVLYQAPALWTLSPTFFVTTVLFIMVLNNYVMGRFHLYSDRKQSYGQLYWELFKTIVVDFAMIAAAMMIIPEFYDNRLFFIYFLGFSLIFLITTRTLLGFYYDSPLRKGFNMRRILIVGDMERGKIITDIMQKQLSWGHEIIGNLTMPKNPAGSLGHIDDLPHVLQSKAVDEVIFALAGDPTVDLSRYLQTCRRMGITTRILPSLWSPDDKSMKIESCQGVPFLTFQENKFNATGLLYKRILDILGGLVGTCILMIIYPFAALAIKLDSPGPVLFKQKRVGQHGRVFDVYKFRSMYIDAEARKQELMQHNEMNGLMFKMADDPRITRVGKWIRKTSVDELPQFLNVLKGQMSLVGTRPPTLDEVERYEDWHYRRISAKPGITGLWQVSGRNTITDFDEIVELDCSYLENWRFLDDIKILFKTVWVVIVGRGAV